MQVSLWLSNYCVTNIRKEIPLCLDGEACALCYELGLQINLVTKPGPCAIGKHISIIKAHATGVVNLKVLEFFEIQYM